MRVSPLAGHSPALSVKGRPLPAQLGRNSVGHIRRVGSRALRYVPLICVSAPRSLGNRSQERISKVVDRFHLTLFFFKNTFFQTFWPFLVSLPFPMNFRIILSISAKTSLRF